MRALAGARFRDRPREQSRKAASHVCLLAGHIVNFSVLRFFSPAFGGALRTSIGQVDPSRGVNFAVLGLLALCAAAMVGLGGGGARAQSSQSAQTSQDWPSEAEKATYADALAYCRGHGDLAITLRDDKQVLCINDWIFTSFDFWTAYGLAQDGVAVVRSSGGEIATTTKLADLLWSKQATVVINDYCLANCANYLFIASLKTFVPKDSLVAWGLTSDANECPSFSKANDGGVPRFDAVRCAGALHSVQYVYEIRHIFYEGRVLAAFQDPPESLTLRRILKRKFDETGKYPSDVYWTWNPRFYASAIRTKVFYEAYPQSQDEVDAIAERFGERERVIYDP